MRWFIFIILVLIFLLSCASSFKHKKDDAVDTNSTCIIDTTNIVNLIWDFDPIPPVVIDTLIRDNGIWQWDEPEYFIKCDSIPIVVKVGYTSNSVYSQDEWGNVIEVISAIPPNCPEGTHIKIDYFMVYASYPPCYRYECIKAKIECDTINLRKGEFIW